MRIRLPKSFAALAGLVFALITFISYYPTLMGKVPFPRDMVLQFPAWHDAPRSEPWQHYANIGDLVTAFYPARVFAARAVREGAIPLWNPFFLSGAPFLASPQSSLFYPPNFLYYLLPVPAAWALCLMIRLFLSGFFMALFMRSIGASKSGSLFAGIVFAFSGFMTAWQGMPLSDSATWLPLVCYAVLRLRNRPSTGSLTLAAFGFAMPVLAGHPETAAHVTLVGIAVAVFAWICRPNGRFLLWFAAASLLAIGISSIQIIPAAEWLSQMHRALDVRWPLLVLHDAFAWVSRDITRAPNSADLWPPEGTAYIGMITFPAAAAGLLHRNRAYVIFFASLTTAAIAAAFGIQPVHWFVSHTPVLGALKNSRMIFIGGFGFAALAGLGISALEEDIPSSRSRRVLALVLMIVAFVVVFVLVQRLRGATTFRVEFMRRPSFSRSLLVIGLIPLLWRLHSGLRARMFPVVACVVVAFDMLTFAYRYTGFTKTDEIFPPSPVFEFLAKQPDTAGFRMAQLGIPYSANANIVYSIASADGYEVLMVPWSTAFFLDYTDGPSTGVNFTAAPLLKLNDRRFDMLNVKYLAMPSGLPEFEQFAASRRFNLVFNNGYVALFENKSVLPRAFAVPASGVTVLNEPDPQLEMLRNPTFDPQRTVIVPSASSLKQSDIDDGKPDAQPFRSSVQIAGSGVNHLSLRTSTSGPGVLVISQTYYPGWQATIDGTVTDVFPANLTLTGIALPAGVHEVQLVFRPLSVKIGMALTSVAVLICLVLAIMKIHNRVQMKRIRHSLPIA